MNFIKFKQFLKFQRERSYLLTKLSLFFFIVGLFLTLLTEPKYDLDIIITKADQDSLAQSQSGSSLISLALAADLTAGSKFFYDFRENFFSNDVTRLYDQEFGGMSKLFSFNKESNTYEPIKNLDTALKSIKYFLLGVEYSRVPSISTLNNFINGSISFRYDKSADNIIISAQTSNPQFIKQLILDLLKTTDNYYKYKEESTIDLKINYLNDQLQTAQSISQRDAISQILKSQMLKYALIKSDSLYKFNVVRDLQISNYPTSPNIAFNLALFALAGLFLGLIYNTFIFAKKHTNLLDFSD